MLEQDLDPFCPRALLERPHQTRPRGVVDGLLQVLGPGDRGLASKGIDPFGRDAVRLDIGELDTVLNQELEDLDVAISERPNDLPIVVAGVCMVWSRVLQVHLVGRVLDAVLLLDARPTSKGNAALADDAVTADIEVLFDNQHRNVVVTRPDRGWHPRRARPDDDDIGFEIPSQTLGVSVLPRQGRHARRSHAGCGTCLDEVPTTQ